jgi:hypothetical protein
MDHLVEVIEPRVFGAINEEITDWIEKERKERWVGKATYDDDDQELDIGLRPATWRTPQGEAAELGRAYFEFTSTQEETDLSWVTTLCGANKDEIGFVTEFDWKAASLAKKDWKALAQRHQNDTPQLSQAGFRFNDKEGVWTLPVRIDAETLAQAIEEDDIASALEPLRAALETLGKTAVHLDALAAKITKSGKLK